MDLHYIKEKVAHIAAIKDDDEAAHVAEDQLRDEFIELVAQVGSPELAEMAREVLKTRALDFGRWCA